MKPRAILDHWKPFSAAWKKAKRNSRSEGVHDLRVETRRLNASLVLLHAVSANDRVLEVRRSFKKVRKRLGPLRDVQVERSLLRPWKSSKSVESFEKSLKREENKQAKRVLKYLTDRRKKKLHGELKRIASVSIPLDSEATQERVKDSLKAAREQFDSALRTTSPDDPARLHALRIAAKTVRYMTEGAARAFGIEDAPGSDADLKTLTTYQTELGELRDLQLLEENILQWSKARSPENRRELDAVRKRLQLQRAARLKRIFR